MPQQWEKFVALPIYRKADKSYFSSYKGMSLLSTEYKIIPYILPFKLMPYVDKMKGNQHCGFLHCGWTTDHTFCICQIA